MSKAVIFDMDGVLVDSMPIHWLAWCKAFEPYGITISRENFKKTPGMTYRPVVALLGGREFSDAEIEDLATSQHIFAEQLLAETYPVIPGAPELIKALDEAGWKMAIATSGPLVNVRLALEKIPEAHRISATVALEDVTCGKPHPEAFLKAAERLDVPVAGCVVVEDSKAGLEAARRGGFAALALTTTFPRDELAPMADLVVDSLTNLSPATIESLLA